MDDAWRLLRAWSRALPLRQFLLLFGATFLLALPLVCYNLQYSAYFFPGNLNYAAAQARNRDELRMAQAESYFNSAITARHVPYEYARGLPPLKLPVDRRDPRAPSLSLVIAAVNRNDHKVDEFEPHYLTQTVAALLRSLDWDARTYGRRWRRLNVSVCNVDARPDRFGEALRVGRLVRVFERQHPYRSANPVCKEKEDFAFCLSRVAVREENDFVVMVEDDMLARLDAMDALWQLVQRHLPRRFGARADVQRRLGVVQLHTPMRRFQYALGDASTWLELMLISAGGTFLLFFLYFRFHCRAYHTWINILLLGTLFLYCGLVALLVGRPHILNARHSITRHYGLGEAPGPNFSVALLPTELVEELTAYVQAAECSMEFTKAKAVHRFVQSHKRRSLAFYPSLFQHIGLYSVYARATIYPYELDA